MGGNRFPPELKMLASAPSANAVFDVGCKVALMTPPSSLRGQKDGLGEEEEKDPGDLGVDIARDVIRYLSKEKRPIILGLKRHVDERRYAYAKDFGDGREERRRTGS